MSGVCFVDTETTGLDPERHEIWNVALITDVTLSNGEVVEDQEFEWFLPVDLGRADPMALSIGHYHERMAEAPITWPVDFAENFASLTRGKHMAGAVISFDDQRLTSLLRRWGACPQWHYHIIDVEALAVGYLWAQAREYPGSVGADFVASGLPWKSDELTRALAVVLPDEEDRHTALGDARWARDIYRAIVRES